MAGHLFLCLLFACVGLSSEESIHQWVLTSNNHNFFSKVEDISKSLNTTANRLNWNKVAFVGDAVLAEALTLELRRKHNPQVVMELRDPMSKIADFKGLQGIAPTEKTTLTALFISRCPLLVSEVVARFGESRVHVIGNDAGVVVECGGDRAQACNDTAEWLANRPEIDLIEAKPKYEMRYTATNKVMIDGINADLSSPWNVNTAWNMLSTLSGYNNYTRQIISIADTGLDMRNCLLSSTAKVVQYSRFYGPPSCSSTNASLGPCGDNSDVLYGHGTHLATVVAGFPAASSPMLPYTGFAPNAGIVFTDIADGSGVLSPPDDLTVMLESAYNAGARIHLNAWGCEAVSSCQSKMRQLNLFAAKRTDMLIIVAASSRSASGDNSDLADAKNVLSIGASMGTTAAMKFAASFMDPNVEISKSGQSASCNTQLKTCTLTDCCPSGAPPTSASPDCCASKYTAPKYSIGSMWPSSPISPSGIVKPELVAIGVGVIGGLGGFNVSGTNAGPACAADAYPFKNTSALLTVSGSSVAAATIAGMALLLREYVARGFMVNGIADAYYSRNPSAALLRALLVTAASIETLDGLDQKGSTNTMGSTPNAYIGFGRPVLKYVMPNISQITTGSLRLFVDDYGTEGGIGAQEYREYSIQGIKASASNPLVITLAWTDNDNGAGTNTIYHPLDLTVQGITPAVTADMKGSTTTSIRRVVITTNPPNANVTIRVSAATDFGSGKQPYALVVRGSFTPPLCMPPTQTPLRCNAQRWNQYLVTSPTKWVQLTGEVQTLSLIDATPFSCRQCVWSLRYPQADPLVIAAPLNCNDWVVWFTAAAAQSGNVDTLSFDEYNSAFFSQTIPTSPPTPNTFPNPIMQKNGLLIPKDVFGVSDMNADGVVSLSEWIVTLHFWAPLILSRTGPRVSTDTQSILGGFFFDIVSWNVWLDQAINVQTNAAIQQNDIPWLRKLRTARAPEVSFSFNGIDLDSSGRYSLEEHYFLNFADLDGDGVLCRTEFDHSIYFSPACQNVNCFNMHDLNGDGTVNFFERKFFSADKDRSLSLSRTEWIFADYPPQIFDQHDLDSNKTIDVLEYLRYVSFTQCVQQSGYTCAIDMYMQGESPYVLMRNLVANVSVPSGATVEMALSIGTSLAWNVSDKTILSNISTTPVLQMLQTRDAANIASKNFGRAALGIFSSLDPVLSDTSQYVCSDPLGTDEGLAVLSMADAPIMQLERLVPSVLISASFLEFICSLFFAAVLVGSVFWLVEHRSNSLFARNPANGIWDGIYFCFVTLTTVGYGDKVCITGLGRIIACLWMLIGVVSFGILSGAITTSINEKRSQQKISGSESLSGLNVGQLADAIGGKTVKVKYAFNPTTYPSMAAAAAALNNGDVTAIVAPATAIIAYFDLPQNDYRRNPCNNPFAIKGSLFAVTAANKICARTASGYVGKTNIGVGVSATNAALQTFHSNGQFTQILNAQLQVDTNSEECPVANPYDIAILVATAVGLAVLGSAAIYSHLRTKQKLKSDLHAQAVRLLENIRVSRDNKIKRFGLHWLRKTREGRKGRIQQARMNMAQLMMRIVGVDKTPKTQGFLRFVHAQKVAPSEESMLSSSLACTVYVKRPPFLKTQLDSVINPTTPLIEEMKSSIAEMRTVIRTLGTDMRSLNKEAYDHRMQLHGVLRFFTLLNLMNVGLIAVIVVILLLAWGV